MLLAGKERTSPQLASTTMCLVKASSSSWALMYYQPDTHHWPSLMCMCSGRRLQPWESMPIARISTAAYGPQSSPGFGPYLQRAPPAVHLHAPAQPPSPASTAVCLWQDTAATVVHAKSQGPCSCQYTSREPWRLPPALAPTTTCVFETRSCHDTDTCICPPQQCVCVPLTLATTSTCPSPQLQPQQTPCCVHPGHHVVVNAVDPEAMSHMPPWTWCCHTYLALSGFSALNLQAIRK